MGWISKTILIYKVVSISVYNTIRYFDILFVSKHGVQWSDRHCPSEFYHLVGMHKTKHNEIVLSIINKLKVLYFHSFILLQIM